MTKLPTTWDFKLFYKSDTDPQIEKDMKAMEKAFALFEKKYKGKDFTATPEKLLKTLKDYESLLETINEYKPFQYFARRKDVDSQNSKLGIKLTQIEQRVRQAANKIAFLNLEIGKIPVSKQKSFLKDPILKGYAYLLGLSFRRARHNISEPEERLSSLLAQPGSGMWMEGHKKLLNSKTVRFKGEDLPFNKAVEMVADLPKKERYLLSDQILDVVESVSHFAEAEINAAFTFKKIMDERRGYAKPYSETVLSYENEEKSVENLVELVTRNFKISKRFYRLQAKLLGEKKLKWADRSVKIGKIAKKFDYETCVGMISQSFAKVDGKYSEMLSAFAKHGQIDVYPKHGKRGGAYCAPGAGFPTLVFLNHVDNVRSFETLAHEMGHAFHSELSRTQPAHYRNYSTSVAEVASTFFEQLALEDLEKQLSPKDQLVLLHARLQGDISTIFAQVAFFNFELEIHNRIRAEGFVPKEEIARIVARHLRTYLGEAVEVTDRDGYFFVRLPHLRYFFYVYSYAFGQLVSRAMFEKWKEDKGFAKKIEQFLSAGGSMSPEDIFKKMGINISDPKFFALGLKAIERDIAKLEKLSKNF